MKCLLPWVHVYYHSDGAVYPCCRLAGNKKYILGNADDNLHKTWNSKKIREMRLDFIKDTPSSECSDCLSNIQPYAFYFSNHYVNSEQQYITNTSSLGEYLPPPRVFTIVNSNICNLKCLYCSEQYSNSIYFDNNGKNKIFKTFSNPDDAITLVQDNINNIDCFVFAAGESSIQDNYYKILDLLRDSNKTDINIQFITNLSTLKYKQYNLIDYLRPFKNATIVGSVDSSEKRQEFIRRNSNFRCIESNIKQIIDAGINFVLQPVITNLNVTSISDLHVDWYASGLLRKDNVRYILLSSPDIYRANNLPDIVKRFAISKLTNYITFLKDEKSVYLNNMTPVEKVQNIITTILKPNTKYSEMIKIFANKGTLDEFYNTFPEFNQISTGSE